MTAGWVLSCGEVLFDVVSTNATNLYAHVGGGPANAALAIANAGLRVAIWSGRPGGIYGDRLAATLYEGGVSIRNLTPSFAPPTLSLASPRGTSVSYEIYAEGTSSFDVREDDAPLTAPDGSPFALVHLGGLGTAINPMAHALRNTAPKWRERGALIGYDPNIRHGFAHRGQSLAEVEAWFGQADVVKVSTEDLETLYATDDPAAAAKRILAFGARLVILTDGPGPVRSFGAEQVATRNVEPWPTDILPVGAGDAFISGVYAALLANGALLDEPSIDGLHAVLDAGLASTLKHRKRISGA